MAHEDGPFFRSLHEVESQDPELEIGESRWMTMGGRAETLGVGYNMGTGENQL